MTAIWLKQMPKLWFTSLSDTVSNAKHIGTHPSVKLLTVCMCPAENACLLAG